MATLQPVARCPHCGQPLSGPSITERERHVLSLLAHGLTAKEIAATLGIARKTTENVVASLYDHLGARNAPHAVMIGLESGYLTEPVEG
jgi:DNA-binding NarL/FixJ family response regulator